MQLPNMFRHFVPHSMSLSIPFTQLQSLDNQPCSDGTFHTCIWGKSMSS